MTNLRKIGGLWHWRIGRIGGSFYWRKPAPARWPRGMRGDDYVRAYWAQFEF